MKLPTSSQIHLLHNTNISSLPSLILLLLLSTFANLHNANINSFLLLPFSICTIPIPSPSFLSQNIFLFSLTFLLLSYNAYLYLFTFTFTTFLFWVIGFPSYLSLSPSKEGDNFFSSCFHIFFFTVNNLQYDRPHNFII